MKALFDTNILIDYLNGIEAARSEIALYDNPMISTISWMEVMIGTSAEDERSIRQFLMGFHQATIDSAVAEEAVTLRRGFSIRSPDAIVWASARVNNALLVTRNVRDFPSADPGIRVPYDL